jgi:uncharacterized oligopeptide transporter (OPT) family protein
MPCFVVLLAALFPRVVLALLFFFTTYLQRAYTSMIILILGFLFLPLTTIVYAYIVNNHLPTDGAYLIALIIAALFDMGLIGHGAYSRRRR